MGSAVGIIILCFFAALWGYLGVESTPDAPAWLAFAPVAVSLAIAVAAIRARPTENRLVWSSVSRPYYIVVGIEVATIILAVNMANAMHRPDLVAAGVALVVGIHFLPLARIFRTRIYFFTGAAMSLLAAGALFAAEPSRDAVVGLGSAMMLWATCLAPVFARCART